MDSAYRANRLGLRTKLAQYSKFLLRWGWFVVLSMALITICSLFIPDSLSLKSYQSTLQVRVQLPSGLNGLPAQNNTTAFFSGVMVSPSTLSLALPKITKLQQFSTYQLDNLQGLITATPVPDTSLILLAATSDTSQDASFLVTTVYQAFLQSLHTQRSAVINGLHTSLTNALNRLEADFANSSADLQNLTAIGQTFSFQFRELSSLNKEQRNIINTINSLLLSLNSEAIGNDGLFGLNSNTPVITTQSAAPPTQSLRLTLSPLVGFIMGLSGALIASRFSKQVPLRGKKREAVLPHIASIIPDLALPRSDKDRVAALQDASSACLPLLRKLSYQFSEQEKSLHVITVTSPWRREGKSTIAALLATAAAKSGLRTVLVDANLLRPVLSTWFKVPNTTGLLSLTNSLAVGVIGPSPIHSTAITKLGIIPIGKANQQTKVNSSESKPLQLHQLRTFIDLLSKQTDLVIFDNAPLLMDTNAIHLAALSDVTLLTVDAQRGETPQVLKAEKLLKDLGVPFTTILNRAGRDWVE